MIPYEDLCNALDSFNNIRRNEQEMASLEVVDEGQIQQAEPEVMELTTEEAAGAIIQEPMPAPGQDNPFVTEEPAATPGPLLDEPTLPGAEPLTVEPSEAPVRPDATNEVDLGDLDMVDEGEL